MAAGHEIHVAATEELSGGTRRALRSFLDRAYDESFSDDDWRHALGGRHAWCTDAQGLLAHGSVVPRTLSLGGTILEVGYVEAVAVRADARRRGIGRAVMEALEALVREDYALGALSAAVDVFYERLGWERWRGPTFVAGPTGLRARDGWVRTAEEDGGVFVRRTARTPALDLDGPIVCEPRAGDDW